MAYLKLNVHNGWILNRLLPGLQNSCYQSLINGYSVRMVGVKLQGEAVPIIYTVNYWCWGIKGILPKTLVLL